MSRRQVAFGLGATLIFCTFLVGILVAAAQAPGTGHGFLIDKHIAAGLKCASCHGASAPTKAVAVAACLTCHNPVANGQFVGSGPRSHPFDGGVTLTFNVHQPHFVDIPCTECHKVHAASVNFCNQCHLMKDVVVP